MKLSTEVTIPPSHNKISQDHKVFSIGSCFADHVATFLKSNKLHTLHNPFGNVYNPVSILNILNGAIGENEDILKDESFIKARDELSVSLHFHSSVNALNSDDLRDIIDQKLDSISQFLNSSEWVFITFGTAVGYLYQGTLVGNCHKIPANEFEKVYIDLHEVITQYNKLIHNLTATNPNLKFIFTLSPVRYFQPSLIDNSKSKSILRLLIDNLINDNENIHYFPSYEILTDELRDYRYYRPDLVQPSDLAIRYILDKFAHIFFNPSFQQLTTKLSQISKVINHKPLNPKSSEYKKLIERTITQISNSDFNKYLSKEMSILQRRLIQK